VFKIPHPDKSRIRYNKYTRWRNADESEAFAEKKITSENYLASFAVKKNLTAKRAKKTQKIIPPHLSG